MGDLSDDRKARILDEIMALTQIPDRQPGDIDASDYADRARCGDTTARRHLDLLVEKGAMTTPGFVYDRTKCRKVRVWRMADPEAPDGQWTAEIVHRTGS